MESYNEKESEMNKNEIKSEIKSSENNDNKINDNSNNNTEKNMNKKEENEEEIYEEGHYPKKEYEYVHDFEWNETFEKEAQEIINNNPDNVESLEEFMDIQSKNWEKFYKFNKTNFFKDRHYILEEFNELKNDTREKITLLDMGCGVGNSFYPLLYRLPNLYVNAFDFSKRAVNMAKTHPIYEKEKHRIKLYDLDLVKDDIPDKNNDYGILMFVLSAIKPQEHEKVIEKISKVINKGGVLYFRDYARYDMAQLRFAQRKKNKVGDNLYMRKDKTLSYFFDKNEIEQLFMKYGFSIVNSNLICRLIENRKENKKMHRLWLQIKFKKD
jgi:2-polyprenyl-3-methyl-5-hydroxy-6-metoxy-1,4-benzoquinol methylase